MWSHTRTRTHTHTHADTRECVGNLWYPHRELPKSNNTASVCTALTISEGSLRLFTFLEDLADSHIVLGTQSTHKWTHFVGKSKEVSLMTCVPTRVYFTWLQTSGSMGVTAPPWSAYHGILVLFHVSSRLGGVCASHVLRELWLISYTSLTSLWYTSSLLHPLWGRLRCGRLSILSGHCNGILLVQLLTKYGWYNVMHSPQALSWLHHSSFWPLLRACWDAVFDCVQWSHFLHMQLECVCPLMSDVRMYCFTRL